MQRKPVHIFISHANVNEDNIYFEELLRHLRPLEKINLCQVFTDKNIVPGIDWNAAVLKALEEANIILFLISPDFVNSNYIQQVEVQSGLARHRSGQVLIIPVIIRPATWQSLPINRYQTLPKNDFPISSWPDRDRDKAWKIEVIEPLRSLIEKLGLGSIQLNKRPENEKTGSFSSGDSSKLKNDVRTLISKADTHRAFQTLLDALKKTNDPAMSEVALIGARLKHLTKQYDSDLIAYDDYMRAQAQISSSLLEILNRVTVSAA